MVRRVEVRRRPLEARSWAMRGGRTQQDSAAAQGERGSSQAGPMRQRGEREKTTRMESANQRRKCILRYTPMACAGRRRERRPAEEVGRHSEGGRGRTVGPGGPKRLNGSAGCWAGWAGS
jgi:hypothetical protein